MIEWLSKNKEWFFNGTGPWILGLIASVIGFFVVRWFKKSSNGKRIKLTQKSGANSTNLQAGGDLHL